MFTPVATKGPVVCVVESEPAAFWGTLISALESGHSVALMNPAWPAAWRERLQEQALAFSADRPAILIPTSGTRSLPKFCIHDLDTVSCAAEGFADRFGSHCILHSVNVLPLHHVGALMPVFRSAACGGLVHFARYQDSGSIGTAPFPLEQACLSLVPTQLGRMKEDPSMVCLLQSFRLILLGGAACPPELIKWARTSGIRLAPCYGSTETAAMVTAMDPESFAAGSGGAGTPLPHARIEIDGQGRVLVRADSNLRGYWPPTEGFSRDPLGTGDLGRMDPDGNLEILGRADRVILTGGENVHPELVEAAALGTGLVSHARCSGSKDPDWGQRVELEVVAGDSVNGLEDRLIQQLKELLPAYAVPKKIRLVDTGELPGSWK
jgi:O-succinylbenzoic acid--CoA ligase